MTHSLNGISASPGIAIGKAFLLKETAFEIKKQSIHDSQNEWSRLENAIQVSKQELSSLHTKMLNELGEDKAAIFSAHLLILEDPELIQSVQGKIKDEKVNAEYALNEVAQNFMAIFESMDNEYMKERAADIRDITKRILSHLLGIKTASLSEINEEVIVVAHDLAPSDTAQLNPTFVKGFITNIGGRTSHTAIMARSLELPAIVGTKTALNDINDGDIIVVDALNGNVLINPTVREFLATQKEQEIYLKQKEEWAKLLHQKTISADGHEVELVANIGTSDDLKGVIENGAEGIGLFRTEFLYMGRNDFPSEDEQYESYKLVLEKMDGKPVVIRTLDIGGDKELSYLNMPKEMNPFLGVRAIRLCLDNEELFRIQLRALLRASIYGNLKIMFPMIATLEEFRKAKSILLDEKLSLQNKGIAVSDTIEIGIMVEIPSTAVSSGAFAKEVDFFSIGTNDLIQYTFAADRMNEKLSYLYQPYHPAILTLVKTVIDAAHKEGKWVGMCGEMAGDPIAIPLLIGLGLDEFSMSASSVLPARSQISTLNYSELQSWMPEILSLGTANEVETLLNEKLSK